MYMYMHIYAINIRAGTPSGKTRPGIYFFALPVLQPREGEEPEQPAVSSAFGRLTVMVPFL